MSLLKVGGEAVKYVAPLAESAAKILVTGGIIVATIKTVEYTGRGIGKGIDRVRHMVGYRDNIFSNEQPKKPKHGNVKTASGNRTAKQLAGDKKRRITTKKKRDAKKVGEKSEALKT